MDTLASSSDTAIAWDRSDERPLVILVGSVFQHRATAEAGRNLFRREGEYWTISYEGAVVHLKDAKGLRHLARLLADPGRVPHRRRDRRAASHAERARLNATRAIRAAMANLARANPALGRHLAATIRTGRYCAYTPDPHALLVWTLT
jgi:hypothetical protein